MNVAAAWEKWDHVYRVQSRPVMDWMLRAARIAGSMTVLDVATGTGQPAIAVADRVRPGGKAIGIDSSAEMLAGCRRLARAAGVDNLELREMDMHALGFSDQTFDAATFGFGLAFARDPVRVMTEIRRVLKPGARVALAVWDEPARNPLFTTVIGALPVAPPDPKQPGPFRLAAHGELPSVLRAAGFTDFTIENVPMTFESPNAAEHVDMMCEMAPVVNAALAGKTDEEVAKVKQAMLAALQPYTDHGKVKIGCMPLCATASRP